MNPPTPQQAQPMSMLARPMAADSASTLPQDSTVMGIIQSHWDFQVCPEEAALVYDKSTSSLVAITTTSSTYGTRPSRARISIPRLGKSNQRQRFFILKIQKPSRNHTIVGVRVVLAAGDQSQVILGDSAPQPLANGIFSRIYIRRDRSNRIGK
jgi:hypothetical protein